MKDAAHALHWQQLARAGLAAFYQHQQQCFWKRQATVSAPSAQSCQSNKCSCISQRSIIGHPAFWMPGLGRSGTQVSATDGFAAGGCMAASPSVAGRQGSYGMAAEPPLAAD